MTGKAYRQEKVYKNRGSSWCSQKGHNKNPMSKRSKSYRKYGWLAEQQIIINSDEISRRDS